MRQVLFDGDVVQKTRDVEAGIPDNEKHNFTHIKYPFHLGSHYDNWCKVMGDAWYLWFVPISNNTDDGLTYPLNPELTIVKN